jgi:hypothetical protein
MAGPILCTTAMSPSTLPTAGCIELLTKHDNGDIDGTEDAQLVCFFEETVLALFGG